MKIPLLIKFMVLGGWLAVATSVRAQSWMLTSAPTQSWTGVASSADGTKLVAVANDFPTAPIYVSTDSGVTWTQTPAPSHSWSAVASSASGSVLVAVANEYPSGPIFVSTNAGSTWTQTPAPASDWVSVASSADGTKLVAVSQSYPSGPIYTSTNSGATWNQTSVTPSGWSGVACSSDGTKIVAVALNFPAGPIYVSGNSGASWTLTGAPAQEWEAVAASANGTNLAAVADYPESISVSVNAGVSWQTTSAPSQSWSAIASSADGSNLVAVANGGDIYQSFNAGSTWADAGAPASAWTAVASSATGSSLAAAVSGGGIYTWQSASPPTVPNAINVVCSRTTFASTAGNSTNNGIFPYNYTPAIQYVGPAPGVAYDAADTNDTGIFWNTLLCPLTTVANASGGNLTTIYEQNLPLTDSFGNPTAVMLNVSFTENNNKTDTIHNAGMNAGTNPGTDGLLANPSALMGQSWVNNGTSEFITFTLQGLTANANYNLYIYGAGQTNGYGGTFSLATANQPTAYAALSTEPTVSSIYRSVFDRSGTNLTAEPGFSWVLLPAVSDNNGNLSFSANKDNGSGIKGSINGFQLAQVLAPSAPYISSIALEGTDLVVNGTNGLAGHFYITQWNANLAQTNWTPVATNLLGVSGSFSLIATNAVNLNAAQQFYRLQVQ